MDREDEGLGAREEEEGEGRVGGESGVSRSPSHVNDSRGSVRVWHFLEWPVLGVGGVMTQLCPVLSQSGVVVQWRFKGKKSLLT